mmetsp:Transcript_55937/g.131125  ORF Transcript_55937/g.131125 Transcript_55937/m.131125 type:complete len:81 (-) Transcript_55937:613-855(-)
MRSLVLPHVSCRIESRGARSPGRGAAEGSARSCNALHLLKENGRGRFWKVLERLPARYDLVFFEILLISVVVDYVPDSRV